VLDTMAGVPCLLRSIGVLGLIDVLLDNGVELREGVLELLCFDVRDGVVDMPRSVGSVEIRLVWLDELMMLDLGIITGVEVLELLD
jgi:hypothetical protein